MNTINQRQEGDKVPNLDVFFLWDLTTPDVYVDLPFLLSEFLSVWAGKDMRGSLLYGGMLITHLARSFCILENCEAMFLTIEPQKSFSTLLYKR